VQKTSFFARYFYRRQKNFDLPGIYFPGNRFLEKVKYICDLDDFFSKRMDKK